MHLTTQPDTLQFGDPVPAERHRFHLLDALRGVAAVLVVLFHARVTFTSVNVPNAFLAVDFFWCLSGFVIAFAYGQRLREGLGRSTFLLLRLIRLYPLYLLGTALGILRALTLKRLQATVSWSALFSGVLLGVAMLPNVITTKLAPYSFPFNIPAWSLFLELLSNIGFAFVAATRAFRPVVLTGTILAAVWLALLALRLQTLNFGSSTTQLGDSLVRVAFSFLSGILLLHAFHWAGLKPLGVLSSIALAFVLTAVLLFLLIGSSPHMHSPEAQLTVVLLCFPVLIGLGALCRLPARFAGVCAFLGDMSYALYILHFPLLPPQHGPLFKLLITHASVALPVYLMVLVGLSWATANFFDAPLRRILNRALKRTLTESRCAAV